MTFITEEEFYREYSDDVLSEGKNIVLIFVETWDENDEQMSTYAELESACNEKNIPIYYVESEGSDDLIEELYIEVLPTVVLFNRGVQTNASCLQTDVDVEDIINEIKYHM